MLSVSIRLATLADVKKLSVIFNKYRSFYGQADDMDLSYRFLDERFRNKQSIVFIAESTANEIVGFSQLYPVFSSISAKSAWILNDLYVNEDVRRAGVASALISTVLDFARSTNAAWITLQTAIDNFQAQALYKRFGFSEETHFVTFNNNCSLNIKSEF